MHPCDLRLKIHQLSCTKRRLQHEMEMMVEIEEDEAILMDRLNTCLVLIEDRLSELMAIGENHD